MAELTAFCHHVQQPHRLRLFENDGTATSFPGKEKAFFFMETSGISGAFNSRQACSVESLVMHNPNLTAQRHFHGRAAQY